MADPDYPKLELDNGEIRVSIYLPDAVQGYYRGARFDWSGIIEHVDTAHHRFYAPLRVTHDPHGHDSVSGPAEEFGMFEPMGFDEAGPGESFVKIGVGLLRKGDESEYRFNADYEILRIDSTPEIEVDFAKVDAPPTSIGEVSTPVVAPAIANAFYALTGRRLRHMPFTLNRVLKALA